MKSMLAATAVLFAAATPATASTLYQSLPDLTVDPVVAGYCSGCGPFLPYRIYDTFTLAAASTINSVTFALDTSFYAGNAVTVGFFNLAGALPGTQIASYTVVPDLSNSFNVPTASERSRSLVTFAIDGLALAAGSYDISFFNSSGLSIPGYAKTGGTLYQSGTFFDPAGFKPNQSAAFSVSGTVPEPASWALMIAGFGLVGAGMRRRVALAA